MTERWKYEPLENLVVTENVRALDGFDLSQLRGAILDIIEFETNGRHFWHQEAVFFDLFGACLSVVFDCDDLMYDLGASKPSSPFRVLTVMLASER